MPHVRIRVLGSAAGGGFPQWNCGCPNCEGVRAGSLRATPRRQESVAVSADDGRTWFLLNASPEIREQIESFRELWPRERRHTPIGGIVLTNGDLDHVLGLLSLRESHPLTLYATESVRRGFTEGNVLYKTLQRFDGQVTWRRLTLGEPVVLGGADSSGPRAGALTLTPFAVPGKRPIHLEGPGSGPGNDEDNVGLLLRAAGATGTRTVAYVPAAAAWTDPLARMLAQADAVFFDGTFWSSAELSSTGVGTKRAEDMAHLPVGGAGGGLARLSALRASRRILIHVNNTNPLLRDDSPERAQVEAAGVEVAFDGMELQL